MAREARRRRFGLRFWLRAGVWLLVCVSTALAARQMHHFAATNPKFELPGTAPGTNTPYFTISGLHYTSRERVTRVFAPDFGRSVFQSPLAERRRRLLAIDWVADASISRVWPNRLLIRIEERVPVAFVSLPQSGIGARIALIDVHGVILPQPPRSKFSFPIVTGLTEEQPETVRAERMLQVVRLERELGDVAAGISEIDVASADNLRITLPMEGRAVELILGDGNYGPRCRNFLNHYPEIRKRSPDATLFDLRMDDRITVRER